MTVPKGKSDECRVTLKVPFHDVDGMQVVWHGHYLKYFEIARDALMAQLGVNLHQYALDSGYLFPIVKSQTKHISPLRYQDEFACTARLSAGTRKIVCVVSGGNIDQEKLAAILMQAE